MKKYLALLLPFVTACALAQTASVTATVPAYANGTATATFVNGGGGSPATLSKKTTINNSGFFRFDNLVQTAAPAYAPSSYTIQLCVSTITAMCYSQTINTTQLVQDVSAAFSAAPTVVALKAYGTNANGEVPVILGSNLSLTGNVLNSTGLGSGATTPNTTLILKGAGAANQTTPAVPGTDYVIPSGNVATANAFSATPSACTAGQFVTGISANGTPSCSIAGGASTPATSLLLKGNGTTNQTAAAIPGTDYVLPNGSITGNAATASSFQTAPAGCTAPQVVQSISANGTPTCVTPTGGANTPSTTALLKGNGAANSVTTATPGTDYVLPSGNVATATALAANPSACTTGQYVTGISANGTPSCSTPAGGVTTPATANLYKGNGSANSIVIATPGSDYVVPSGNITGTASSITGNLPLSQTTGTLGHSQLPTLLSADIPNNAASTSGNAATATALATAPSACGAGLYVTAISANGTPTCAAAGGATTPNTSLLLKGNGAVNSVTMATPGTDYVVPSALGTIAPKTASGSGTYVATQSVNSATANDAVIYNADGSITDSGLPAVPLGTAGQFVTMNSGASSYTPVTISGDCTSSSGTPGALTCTKTGGTNFGTAATTNSSVYDASGAAATAANAVPQFRGTWTNGLATVANIGDTVTFLGAQYSSLIPNNQGNNPLTTLGTDWTPVGGLYAASLLSPGTNHLWMTYPGQTGNTIPDTIGGATATSASLTHATDGGLVFTSSPTNRLITTASTGFLTMSVAFVAGIPTSNNQIPMAYETSNNSTYPDPAMLLMICDNPGCGGASYNTHWAAFTFAAANNPKISLNPIVPGTVNVMSLVLTPSGVTKEYLNGVAVTPNADSTQSFTGPTLTGGVLVFGGTTYGASNNCGNCGFAGTIYAAWTNAGSLTAQQELADYQGIVQSLAQNSVNVNQNSFVRSGAGWQSTANKPIQLLGIGESNTWGHGLSSPSTLNYIAQAAYTINGGNAFAAGLGQDSNDGFEMIQEVPAFYPLLSPNAQNVVLLSSNANGCKPLINSKPPYNVAQVEASLIVKAALMFENPPAPYVPAIPIIAMGDSANNGAWDVGKDTCNPVLRQAAIAAGIPLWDLDDPRTQADGASGTTYNQTGANSTACSGTYGGVTYSAGPVYQTDWTHHTACYNGYAGANLGNFVNRLLLAAPTKVTATTYTMTGMEEPLNMAPTANATVTLIDCIGQSQTSKPLHIVNLSAYTITLQPVNTYTTETINGMATATIPANGSISLTAINSGDTTGGCTWRE